MEKLKTWAREHKALAIGGGIGLLVLIYLWWRSGSSTGSSSSGLNSYYAAAAQNAQADAALQAQQSQDQAASYAVQQQTTAQNEATQAAVQINQANANAQLSEVQALVPELEQQNSLTALVANRQTTEAGYQAYTSLLEQYKPSGAAEVASFLAPPPGANPADYVSTAAAPSPGAVADTLTALRGAPGLKHAYLEQVASTGVS